MFEFVELLAQVNSRILRALTPLIRSYNISFSELILLWKINKRQSCKITDLAGMTGVPASTLTTLFDRLEAKDLIARAHDEKDRRCILINRTAKLTEMLENVIAQADTELCRLFEKLDSSFLGHFMGDLKLLQEYLEQNEIEAK